MASFLSYSEYFFQKNWLLMQFIVFSIFVLALLLRLAIIGNYGLSDDEVLKALAAQSYLELDFSANASHPSLMKIAITFSVLLLGESEFSVRLPNALVSALTVYPIFLLGRKLYNAYIGCLSSLIWAIHLPAIAFATTAKEDTFLAFFWTVSVYYYVRARENPKYFRHTGFFVGLSAASKFAAVFLVILLVTLYFLNRKEGKALPSVKETAYLSIPPGIIAFAITSFPLFFPKTISNFLNHYTPDEPAHSGWIMMGEILSTRPPYYLVQHILIKTPLPVLLIITIGIFFALKKRTDSDIIFLLWIFILLGFFSVATYGFARYYLATIPAFVLLASHGVFRLVTQFNPRFRKIDAELKPKISKFATILVVAVVCLHSLLVFVWIFPYSRMYVNELGGGSDKSGFYFPQDSVYDYFLREAIHYINENAAPGATVAMIVTSVGDYYGREDLNFVFIRDLPPNISQWDVLNVSFAIVQDSRIYNENKEQISGLRAQGDPEKTYSIFDTIVAEIYRL
jgi:4-amino-4-deoxy-L-arabinose transferase-like glycosyltransferase